MNNLKEFVKLARSVLGALFLNIFVVGLASADTEQIYIGVATALSGEGASWGFDIRDSLLFANKHLTGGKYQFIFQDDKCDPKEGLTATKELLEFSKVKFALGFTCSGPALVSVPFFNKKMVPLIITSASSPQLKTAGEYIFRTMPSDAIGARLLVDYIEKQDNMKTGKLAILSSEGEFTQDLKNVFLNSLKEKNISPNIEIEDYPPTSFDFRSQLLKLKSRGVTAIFINAQFEQSFLTILKQLREYKWAPKLYAAYHPANPTVLNAKPENLEGIVFFDSPNVDKLLTVEGKKLFADYKKEYGPIRSSELVFLANYEGLRALHLAISSGEDVKEFLKKTEFNGIFGPWHFDENGEIVGLNFGLKTINGFQVVGIE